MVDAIDRGRRSKMSGSTITISEVTGRSGEDARPARLHYLDWLRLFAILGVFLYHASRPFIIQEWLITNNETSMGLTIVFYIFLGTWGMPLFFFIAGTGSYFALRRRTGRQYFSERVKRLLIPFFVGCLILSPIQFYLEWLHKGWYEGSFPAFIPILLEDRTTAIKRSIGPPMFDWLGSHLWFLAFLFFFALLALPLFLWFKRDSGRRFITWLGRLGEYRGGLLIFIIPIAVTRNILQPGYGDHANWAEFVFMFLFFLCGYILYSDERLKAAIARDWALFLAGGLIATGAMLVALASGVGEDWIESPGTAGFVLVWILVSINAWCWTMFVLSLAMRFLQFRNNWLDYGQDALVPFFIFHQPVIILIAFFVVQGAGGIAVKLPIIVVTSFLFTLGFYELVLKRIGPARTLFGMKEIG